MRLFSRSLLAVDEVDGHDQASLCGRRGGEVCCGLDDEEASIAQGIAAVVGVDIQAAVEELEGDDAVGVMAREEAALAKEESDHCEGAVFKERDLAVAVDGWVGFTGEFFKGPVQVEV